MTRTFINIYSYYNFHYNSSRSCIDLFYRISIQKIYMKAQFFFVTGNILLSLLDDSAPTVLKLDLIRIQYRTQKKRLNC